MKHYYSVVFPQLIEWRNFVDGELYCVTSSSELTSRNLDDALEKCERLGGAYVEKIIIKKGKRFCKWFILNPKYKQNFSEREKLYSELRLDNKIILGDFFFSSKEEFYKSKYT